MDKISKLAVANRGEVAVRIIRACQELGIETVLLHSEADRESIAFRIADETYCIGSSEASESYLNIASNIQGALASGADAIHPGFGFLSENADFARACEDHRILFVGPSAQCIELFGDKISAKKLVIEAGAPTVPGYEGQDQSMQTLVAEVGKIGCPVIVKAAAGGGGRGMRVIHQIEDAESAIESAKRESIGAFGSDKVFLEKYIDGAKHIEVQIFGDQSGRVFSLLERECSIQRRHQKVIEEAVCTTLSEEQRREVSAAAQKIAEAADYRGAGTVEFLFHDGQFYFMEVNTRLQVEHPVTEMVMGVDLVKAQILTAAGRSLLWDSEELRPNGHAIECRIYVEDPYKNGLPSIGQLGACLWPYGPGRRFEIGFEEGDEITSFYDSMIAKVVVWDESRPRALIKMKKTLEECVIFGLQTNLPYLLKILDHPEFVDGTMTTKFVETHYPTGLQEEPIDQHDKELMDTIDQMISEGGASSMTLGQHVSGPSPWMAGW